MFSIILGPLGKPSPSKLEESTLVNNALAVYHSDQNPTEGAKKPLGRTFWKINNRKRASLESERIDQSQSFQSEALETAKMKVADGGRQQVRAQQMQNSLSSTMTRREEQTKVTSDIGHQVQHFVDSLLREEKTAPAREQVPTAKRQRRSTSLLQVQGRRTVLQRQRL